MEAIIFPILGALVSLGGIFIAVGTLKHRIYQAAEDNKTQDERMKSLTSKDELAAAIRRSDEMLEIMTKRAEEDRAKGQGQWKEFHEILARHAKQIGVLENQQSLLMKSLDEIKSDIKGGFKELQAELKELRKVHYGVDG